MIAAALVLICLAAVATYTMFSGPTTISVPSKPGAAPSRTFVPPRGDEGAEADHGD